MTNKERLEANNAKIDEITKALTNKQVSPTDMLQARVDSNNSCKYLLYGYEGESIDFIKDLDTSNVTNMSSMFENCKKAKTIDISGLDTSKVTNMSNMFSECNALTDLDVSKLDTRNVTTTNKMFYCCYYVKELDVSNFNTSNMTDMGAMFSRCQTITNLDVSNFDTSNVTAMNSMFQGCKALNSIDVSNFDTSKVTNMTSMFDDCYNVPEIDLSNFDMSNVTSAGRMFYSCQKAVTIKGVNWEALTSSLEYSSVFDSCDKLVNLGIKNVTQSFTFKNNAFDFSNESLFNLFKEMWDYTGTTARKFKTRDYIINRANSTYVKLIDITDEMRAEDKYIDKKKPCVVCESTDDGAMTLVEYATSKNWSIVQS